MTTLGIDYSYGRPSPKAIKAAGYKFVARYLSRTPGKNIDLIEAKALIGEGIDIVLVWETTANRALSGQTGGAQDGVMAANLASALGAPARTAIYFAVDFDARPSQFPVISDYLAAAGATCKPHPNGVYGSFSVCQDMMRRRVVTYAWQTAAWSHGSKFTDAHLYQRIKQVVIEGVTCDVNEAQHPDYGGWFKPNIIPAFTPPPIHTRGATVFLCQPDDGRPTVYVCRIGDDNKVKYLPLEDPDDRDRFMATNVPFIPVKVATWQGWGGE